MIDHNVLDVLGRSFLEPHGLPDSAGGRVCVTARVIDRGDPLLAIRLFATV